MGWGLWRVLGVVWVALIVAGGIAAWGARGSTASRADEVSVAEADPGVAVGLGAIAHLGAVVRAAAGGSRSGAARGGKARSGAVDALDVEVVQTTADLTQHLTRLGDVRFQPISAGGRSATAMPVIVVNDLVRYQRVQGFGGAMTDSSAWLIRDELPATVGSAVMSGLFASDGIHLSFLRVPIGASDFTRNGVPYTYDDMPSGRSDPGLSHFSIAHDAEYIIPALRQTLAANPLARVLATPWSPPAWMKNSLSLSNVRHRGTLRYSDFRPWARYVVKFIQAYGRAGVPISAVTAQNEPTNPSSYPGLELSEPGEARWIKSDLAPALRAAHLRTRIYAHDGGWSPRSANYAKMLVADRAASRVLRGLAWHCYFGSPYLMSTVRRMDRSLDQIVDECSPGMTPFPTAEVVIGSIRNWASTVALWNLALDPQGGPVQAPNTGCPNCSGLVTVDERTHSVGLRLSYFQLGQASSFVQPGARRVDSPHYVFYDYQRPGENLVTPGLDDVAFVNPDGSRVLVAYDNSNAPIPFTVDWHNRSFTYTLPAEAMVTFVWDRKR
jgi:glucosylceramidase